MPVDNHEHAGHIMAVAKAARQAAIDKALTLSDDHDVWLIQSKPTAKQRQLYTEHDAVFHHIDPGKDTVMSRVKRERPKKMLAVAATFYKKTPLSIHSGKYGHHIPGAMAINASYLPNPHDEPSLRMLNGTNTRVADWLGSKTEVQTLINNTIERIDQENPATVLITCNAGKHRSVYVAEQLAKHYGVEAVHHELKKKAARKASTTERGYGWKHQKTRERLLRNHVDGTPCDVCGKPMYKDPTKNWDGAKLEAEHPIPQMTLPMAQRRHNEAKKLLHRFCNRSEGGKLAHEGKRAEQIEPVVLDNGFNWGGATPNHNI